MLESWPVVINVLLVAWAVRTLIILQLAFRNRTGDIKYSKGEPTTATRSDEAPLVSIIIPAFNEAASISKTVLSCLQSMDAIKELIVVDDGSTDDTRAVAFSLQRQHPEHRIQIITSDRNQGKANALNLGLNRASGDIIVTVDADTQFESGDTLTALLQPLITQPEIAATTANLKIANPTTMLGTFQAIEYAKIIQTLKRAQSQTHAILILPGALSAFRQHLLRAIGGFSKATLAEDADATMALLKQGHHACLQTRACGFTTVPTSVAGFIKQRIRWRVGQWQCLWKHRALARHSWATGFFYLDVVATNGITAATPAFVVISLWQIIHAGDGQSFIWALSGFVAADILVTTTTAQLDRTFRPSPKHYASSLLFFVAINPVITWLCLIKLFTQRPIHW